MNSTTRALKIYAVIGILFACMEGAALLHRHGDTVGNVVFNFLPFGFILAVLFWPIGLVETLSTGNLRPGVEVLASIAIAYGWIQVRARLKTAREKENEIIP